ncbi:GAF and ANTAR domain-containing protein [Streptomyces sp. NPDC012935]|uniref:GAF and ANTAR domain-containing protein n=1 Tax=Streptomyces sp. NPDC012935 TaxID=3364857 RepID=UPI0036A3F9AA
MVADAEQTGEPLLVVRQVAAALADATPWTVPDQLCRAYQQAMAADSVVLSALPHTAQCHLIHATGPLALQGEEAQFTLGDGPTITASACGRPVLVPDLRTTTLPLSAHLAACLPAARTVLAVPVSLRQVDLGVITLYYTQPRTIGENAVGHAHCAAQLAVEPLIQARETLAADGDDWPMPAPWSTVHEAIGMISARLGCPAADALDLLRGHSFTTGYSLPHIAIKILTYFANADSQDDDPGQRAAT